VLSLRLLPSLAIAALGALSTTALSAERYAGAAQLPGAVIAIEHATVFVPSGPPLKDATVVLVGGSVRAVGTSVAAPANARHIDARGKVVTTGLIDSLARAGVIEVEGESLANDADPAGGELEPEFRIRDGYNPRSSVVPISRVAGITSVVVAPAQGLLSGEAALVDLAGERVDQAVVRDAVAQIAVMDGGTIQAIAGARGEAWERLRTALEDARFYSTHKAAYDDNRVRPLVLPRPGLAALEPVVKGLEPLVLFVNRASDIELALKLATDFKLKLVIAGGIESWLLASELAARKVPVVIDPWQNLPSGFDSLRVRDDLAALLSRAGVIVALSTFSPNESRQLTQRAAHAVRNGMDHDAAVRAVTDAPAAAFGLRGYGRLEPGAVANVVVWSGDPLENATRVERVFIHGEEQSMETRQTLLLNRYRRVPMTRAGETP
jgi:imidazolonepropionase-like amidohydrolase